MATLKPSAKIAARPQIKAVQQPIPRQVILPKKAQPVVKPVAKPIAKPVAKAPAKATGMVMPTNVIPRQNISVSQAEAQRIMNMQKAPSIPMMAQPLPSLPMQSNKPMSIQDFQNKYIGGLGNSPIDQSFVNQQYDNYLKNQSGNNIMGQSSVGTVGYPANGSGTSIYQGQQNPVMPNMPAPTMGESSVGSIGYPASMGGGVAYQGYGEQLPLGGNPMFNPAYNAPDVNNPLFAGFSAPISDPYMPQPFTGLNQPVGMNNVAPVLAQNTANYQMYGKQLPLGGNPMFNPMYNAPDVNNPLFAGYSAPMPNNMNQQGFVPMGGSNPQNTSYGSFGAIQQPMGGFGNIGSLLGKG